MCTALSFRTKDHYFGRNLDLERSYGEQVCVTPRNYPFVFRKAGELPRHPAIIGAAVVADGIPLYFEGTNEQGLSMAGLNFPGNAWYGPEVEGKDNVAPFEFIPWILGQCATVAQARVLLNRINLIDLPFSDAMPLSPLHWMISDREESIVVEAMREGMKVHDNPAGVLTNNPPFEFQRFNLNNYRGVGVDKGENRFSDRLDMDVYCLGLGGLGLPGDLSSMSRFVRAAFTKLNAVGSDDEMDSVGQFFHILGSVEQTMGCSRLDDGKCEYTVYSCCANADKGIFYYVTYGNRQICSVDMRRENLDGRELARYDMIRRQQVFSQN